MNNSPHATCNWLFCKGHKGKYSNCLSRALYTCGHLASETVGDVNVSGLYDFYSLREPFEVDLDGYEFVIPAGTYILTETPDGFVSVSGYDDEEEAWRDFKTKRDEISNLEAVSSNRESE